MYLMVTAANPNIDKSTVRQLFRAVVKTTDEMNETSFVHGQNKRRFKVDTTAQGSGVNVPHIFRDQIVLTTKGFIT